MKELKWLTPGCCKDKRNFRIQQALNFKKGEDVNNQVKNIIYKDSDIEIGFLNPGKDDGKENGNGKIKRDLTPYVNAKNYPLTSGSFVDIWGLVCKLQNILDEEGITLFYRLIYRLAFMFDFELNDDESNYVPSEEFINDIEYLQSQIDKKKVQFNLKSFVAILDLIGWNEDYKFQLSNNVANGPWVGRLNCLMCMISVPIELSKLHIRDGEKVNFDSLLDMCYAFSMSRGIFVSSKDDLIKYLNLSE